MFVVVDGQVRSGQTSYRRDLLRKITHSQNLVIFMGIARYHKI